MKGILTLAAAVAAALVTAPPGVAQGAPPKIGVIDVQRIVGESAVGKESLARVQKVQQSKQEELAKRQKDLRELEQKITEQGKSLSEEALDKIQKEYQAKALDLKRFQDDAQRELEDTQRKELGELEKRIMPVIDAVAKEQGYTLIFNKFQSGLLFAGEGTDITESVIQRFNSQIASSAKPGAAAPASAKPGTAAPATAKPATAPAPKKN
jgi:outer membrane protein